MFESPFVRKNRYLTFCFISGQSRRPLDDMESLRNMVKVIELSMYVEKP